MRSVASVRTWLILLYSQSRHPLAATNGGHRQRMGLGFAWRRITIVAPDKGAKNCASLRATLLSDSLAGELWRQPAHTHPPRLR